MHFFIEKDLLQPQTVTEQFGPVDGNEVNHYKTTAQFQLGSSAKAFAPVKSQLIIQQNSSHTDLVNVVLKPINQVKLHNIAVKYFILRGIQKDSFLQGSSTSIVNSGSEFIQKFWANYYDWVTKMDTPPPLPEADALGYDQGAIDDADSIRSVYMNGHDVRSVVVDEGMWIGNFTHNTTIGMDIVLANSDYFPTLKLARVHQNIIDATGLTGFDEKKKREQILPFIDPAAFYGLHFDKGVKVDGTNTKLKEGELYTELIEHFNTKNTIYLDIRNEEGYSYNFFGNYDDGSGNNLKLGIGTVAPTLTVYENHQWPILAIDATTVPVGSAPNFTDLNIELHMADNPEPLIFHTDIVRKPRKPVVFTGTDAIANVSGTWTKQALFQLFNNASQGVANYLRVNYTRQVPYTGSNPAIPVKNDFHTNLFGSIHLPNFNSQSITNKYLVLGSDKMATGKTIKGKEFCIHIKRKAYWDSDVILFEALKQHTHKKTNEYTYSNTIGVKYKINLGNTNDTIALNKLLFNKYRVVEDSEFIDILTIDKNDNLQNELESYSFLGITQDELNSLSKDNLDTDCDAFIELIPLYSDGNNTIFRDNDRNEYYKYKLVIKGYDSNGNFVEASPNGSIILVYSIDGFSFFSNDFIKSKNIEKVCQTHPGGKILVHDLNGYLKRYRSELTKRLNKKYREELAVNLQVEFKVGGSIISRYDFMSRSDYYWSDVYLVWSDHHGLNKIREDEDSWDQNLQRPETTALGEGARFQFYAGVNIDIVENSISNGKMKTRGFSKRIDFFQYLIEHEAGHAHFAHHPENKTGNGLKPNKGDTSFYKMRLWNYDTKSFDIVHVENKRIFGGTTGHVENTLMDDDYQKAHWHFDDFMINILRLLYGKYKIDDDGDLCIIKIQLKDFLIKSESTRYELNSSGGYSIVRINYEEVKDKIILGFKGGGDDSNFFINNAFYTRIEQGKLKTYIYVSDLRLEAQALLQAAERLHWRENVLNKKKD